ncbi:hypothetical protein NJ7G_0145 [Natrinema sp. J7-2]|nr:hypothetical protein NJ7G_0145 [Natrinema sp. J7-2]
MTITQADRTARTRRFREVGRRSQGEPTEPCFTDRLPYVTPCVTVLTVF